MVSKRKSYTREFKVETVKLVTDTDTSVSQIAHDMGKHGKAFLTTLSGSIAARGFILRWGIGPHSRSINSGLQLNRLSTIPGQIQFTELTSSRIKEAT